MITIDGVELTPFFVSMIDKILKAGEDSGVDFWVKTDRLGGVVSIKMPDFELCPKAVFTAKQCLLIDDAVREAIRSANILESFRLESAITQEATNGRA